MKTEAIRLQSGKTPGMDPKEASREHANRGAMDLLECAMQMRDCRGTFGPYRPRRQPPLLMWISDEEALYGAGHQANAE